MTEFNAKNIDALLERAANRIGMRLVNAAQPIAPYRKGVLFRSIDYKVENIGGSLNIHLGSNVKYAKFQEEGNARMKALGKVGTAQSPYKYASGAGRTARRPFLANALFMNKKLIVEELKAVFNGTT